MRGYCVGVDGCRPGWVAAIRGPQCRLQARCFADMGALLAAIGPRAWIGIDVPIGLTEAGPRACDRLARRVLGWPRSASVFPAPVRSALGARTREEADLATRAADNRGVGAQAWNIYHLVAQVDEALREGRTSQGQLREVHPEVAFWAWNGGQAMASGKKTPGGRQERRALVDAGFGAEAFPHLRSQVGRQAAADDDLLDALAALWSALRMAEGRARTLPDEPVTDACGLRMEIVY